VPRPDAPSPARALLILGLALALLFAALDVGRRDSILRGAWDRLFSPHEAPMERLMKEILPAPGRR